MVLTEESCLGQVKKTLESLIDNVVQLRQRKENLRFDFNVEETLESLIDHVVQSCPTIAADKTQTQCTNCIEESVDFAVQLCTNELNGMQNIKNSKKEILELPRKCGQLKTDTFHCAAATDMNNINPTLENTADCLTLKQLQEPKEFVMAHSRREINQILNHFFERTSQFQFQTAKRNKSGILLNRYS